MSNWNTVGLWILVIFTLCTAAAGLGLGAWCYQHKVNKDSSVPAVIREYEAESHYQLLEDLKSLPNAISLTFKSPHEENPYFDVTIRSTLDGYARPSFLRELTTTGASLEVLPDYMAGGNQTEVYDSLSANLISVTRLDHVHHRNLIHTVATPYKVASDALVNANAVVNGLSCAYYSDRTYTAVADEHSTLFYTFYSPLTNSWTAPEKVTQYLNSTALGHPYDFAMCVLNKNPAIAWVNPQATDGTTNVQFRYLKSAVTAASGSCVNRTLTTAALANTGSTLGISHWYSSTLAMTEFGTSAVIGYITDVFSVQSIVLRVAPVGDVLLPTYNFGSAISVATTTTNSAITVAARNLQLTPFTHSDGTQRLIVSFTVAGSSTNTGIAYMSSTANLDTCTWSLIAVTPANGIENTLYSNFVMLQPTPGNLVAVWQNATTGLLNYARSINTAGVISFSTDVKVIEHKCTGTFTAEVIAPGEFGVLYQVASDATRVLYRSRTLYAYVVGDAVPTYSTLYMHDGYESNGGTCVGLGVYEEAPTIFLSGGPAFATGLFNFQGVKDNRAMIPGLRVNYHVH
jgi:hypothetical protein